MFSFNICGFNIEICDFNTIVTCNCYKNVRLYKMCDCTYWLSVGIFICFSSQTRKSRK